MTEEDKTPLSAAQVDALLPTLEGWTRSEAVLARTFVFPNVSEITAFLTPLVRTMTEQQHSDFSLNTRLKMVSVAFTTQSEQALARADLQFARALNAWKRESGALGPPLVTGCVCAVAQALWGQTGPTEGCHQCGNTRLCWIGATPEISL